VFPKELFSTEQQKGKLMPSIDFDPILNHYKVCLILRYHLKGDDLIEFIEKARLTSKYSFHDILKILYNLPKMYILWWEAILNSIKVQMSMKIYPKEFDYFSMHINDGSLDVFIEKSFYEKNPDPYEIPYEDFYDRLLNKVDPYIMPYTPYIPKSLIPLQVKPYKGISININNPIILNPLT
jgi:hypothetical protein